MLVGLLNIDPAGKELIQFLHLYVFNRSKLQKLEVGVCLGLILMICGEVCSVLMGANWESSARHVDGKMEHRVSVVQDTDCKSE